MPSFKQFDSDKHIEIRAIPEECPICHLKCFPRCLGLMERMHEGVLQRVTAVFLCPNTACTSLFFGYYEKQHGAYLLCRCAPITPAVVRVPQNVAKISRTGTMLLNQAEAAFAHELHDLVGPGLRKALEFFIKDFLISMHGDKAESIKKAALGNCVNTWVTDANLKKAAERAVWLGNDETHYLKVWNDHDITDLRRLIHLTINWIDSELTLAEYEKEMPAKK